MLGAIHFEFPFGWQVGLPLVVALLLGTALVQRRRGGSKKQRIILLGLRAFTLLFLVFLAARPVLVKSLPPAQTRNSVVLLLDRSESMSLVEESLTRFEQALKFGRELLLPALRAEQIVVDPYLFDQELEPTDGAALSVAKPQGRRTNLAGAIARALASRPVPPLAIVALTDGALNETGDNGRGLAALIDKAVPLVAVGIGSDTGARTLSLRSVEGPPAVAPNSAFNVSAQLEMVSSEEIPTFDLVLFRDGQVFQQKSVTPGKGSRFWQESFPVSEKELGAHEYVVQFLPPAAAGLKCLNMIGTTTVRVTDERELRILYVQGALTWDYKFVSLALRGDPALKLTGLTRTSKQSVFRQNVEKAGELAGGFPTTIEEIANYRVIVMSNLRPIDLSPTQQELLARFCSELGGGLLLIGGPDTFDGSWKRSRLEQLLPVTFADHSGGGGMDRPFRLQLTDEAWQHGVFQLGDPRQTREAWSRLPPFLQYGRVESSKPGAHIWARHSDEQGPEGKRILMAWQRYGAGLSAIIACQNLWKWRLAREGDPAQFDRFWRQLFRFISEASRQDVTLHLADQDLRPQMDVQLVVERQAGPDSIGGGSEDFFVRVEAPGRKKITDQKASLTAGRPVDLKFRAETAGLYQVTVFNMRQQPVATRLVEIRDVNLEFENTARNMEALRQWASVSGGLALKIEECGDGSELIQQIRHKVEQVRRAGVERRPMGVNAWTFIALLGCLGSEWWLRKRWNFA